jgi:hypothetical protein
MKKSNALASPIEIGDLEFPDWSGMNDSAQRVSADAAFQFSEQYPQWFPEQAKRWQTQRPEKCVVEFKL